MTALEIARSHNKLNIVGFKNDSLYNCVENYLEYHRKNSKNTWKNYKGYIQEFIQFLTGKEIASVSWAELEKVTYNDAENYRNYLLNNGNKEITVNNKLNVLKDFWIEMFKNNRNLDMMALELKPLKVKKEVHYDSLTEDEVFKLFNYCETELNYKKEIQLTLFQFLFMTSMRINTVLALTLEDIKKKRDKKAQKQIHYVSKYVKGKEVEIALPDWFVGKIVDLERLVGNKLFEINDKTLRKTLENFCKKENITDRNIVLHSIKSSSGDYILDITENLFTVAEQLQHTKVETTVKNYVNKNKSLADKTSYWAFDALKDNNRNVDVSALEELDKDQLLELISNLNKGVQIKLNNMAKDLLQEQQRDSN